MPQILESHANVFGFLRVNADQGARCGLTDLQVGGMESDSAQQWVFFAPRLEAVIALQFGQKERSTAVEDVRHYRMTQGAKMHPDLVGLARERKASQEGVA